MNEKLRAMRDQIVEAGGIVGYREDCPDEVLELMFKEIFECPHCREQLERAAMKEKQGGRSH